MKRTLAIGAVALVGLLGVAAGACKLTGLDCGLGAEPAQDYFRGRAGYGRAPTELPAGFRQEVVASGLVLPTSFAFLPRGIAVAEKAGTVRLVDERGVSRSPILDLRRRVNGVGYRGLLAIEPDPAFARNGFLYLLYVREDGTAPADGPRTVRVSRVTVRRGKASPASERVLVGNSGRGSCNDLPSGSDCVPCDGDHCGGDIEFASDGTMFISTGDGWNGSAGFNVNPPRAQDLDLLAGKILRVDRLGKGVAGNPFHSGDGEANRSKVWAYGLRNPFRLTLRPPDEVPYVGDVGWNTTEEVNVARRGANMGWPCFEGEARPPEYEQTGVCRRAYAQRPATGPLYSYRLGSVTGGVFYGGDMFPTAYRGTYIFGDWSRNVLRVLRVTPEHQLSGDAQPFGRNAAGPVQLEVGPDGSLYYLATNVGELRRIVYVGG